jgi:hypothetical protein
MICALQGVALADEIRGIPRIVDGDTVQVGTAKIRLQGIDAPETDQLCLDRNGKRWTCGIEACVAAALGALTGTTPATDANAATPSNPVVEQPKAVPQTGQPNTLVSVGQDLLAFTINEQGDGSIVAQHVSHASHSSHSSHSSHFSSR